MDERKKFLIIRLSALGDIIHALPLAYVLKQKYPNSQVDWVVGDKFASLIQNNPLIDNCHIANLSKWKKNPFSLSTIRDIKNLDKTLQKEKYDYSIDVHGMFKSLIINAFCGAEKRIAYSDYRELAPLGGNILIKSRAKRPYRNYHIIKRQLDLLLLSGLITQEDLDKIGIKAILPPSSKETKERVDSLLSNLDSNKKNIVFAPATTWDNKHWAVENWQKLYQNLKDKANIIFSGVQKDLDLINKIKGSDEHSFVLAGKTNQAEYIELLRRADIIISPDSSAAHIAWAVGVNHIFTIFCATSKHTFGPLGHTNFPLGDEICVPCHKRKCKNPICTKQTSAREVLSEILKHLS